MTHVITQGCCNDGRCVEVCPAQCIRPRLGDSQFTTAEQLYIDPDLCIDCGACLEVCPVDAIREDYNLPSGAEPYLSINADYFARHPIEDLSPLPLQARRPASSGPVLRVAIVGAGPAGCYAAAALLAAPGVEISMFDRLPTPHGLARAGVAPDHPKTRKIGDDFDATLSDPRVTCFFNVEVGRDVGLTELLHSHQALIWSGGAAGDRRLGIPGENLPGCHSADAFVAWYNGVPEFADAAFDLTGGHAIVIGAGNVALDAARMLIRDPAELARTDMADHALDALRASGVTEVTLAARRGPAEAAYTLPELLALTQLKGVSLSARREEIGPRPTDYDGHALKLDLVERAAQASATEGRRINLRYFLSPVSINGAQRVESVTFQRNALTVEDGVPRLRPTGEMETIAASLVLRAVGYRGRPVPGLPFDEAAGTLANRHGRVVDPASSAPLPGVYCAGWIKRGPTGGLGANKWCSGETVDNLLADFDAGRLAAPTESLADLIARIAERRPSALDFTGWTYIDAAERRAGRTRGVPRRKFVRVEDMLAAASPQDVTR
jgi:ferredoxin--NADP+ reductase